jgi:hypothetical protein
MIVSLRHLLGWVVSAFSSRVDLVLENLALRRQLLALHTQRPRRLLTALHRLFWVVLRTFWSGWRKPLVLVSPRTVVNWTGFGSPPEVLPGLNLRLDIAPYGRSYIVFVEDANDKAGFAFVSDERGVIRYCQFIR